MSGAAGNGLRSTIQSLETTSGAWKDKLCAKKEIFYLGGF
jgi:hypothetical protein